MAAFLAVLFAVLWSTSACMAGQQSVGTVTSVHGTVTIKRPGQEEPARLAKGNTLMVGDVVQAGAGSGGQVTLTDESFLNIGAGASLRISQYSFDEKSNRRTAVVRVLVGRVRCVVYVVRSPGSAFRVETDTASIFVDDLADLVVEAVPDRTDVSVLEHTVRVRNASALIVGEARLGINQKVAVYVKRPPSVPGVVTPAERRRYLLELSR
jgi:hypothetical protein